MESIGLIWTVALTCGLCDMGLKLSASPNLSLYNGNAAYCLSCCIKSVWNFKKGCMWKWIMNDKGLYTCTYKLLLLLIIFWFQYFIPTNTFAFCLLGCLKRTSSFIPHLPPPKSSQGISQRNAVPSACLSDRHSSWAPALVWVYNVSTAGPKGGHLFPAKWAVTVCLCPLNTWGCVHGRIQPWISGAFLKSLLEEGRKHFSAGCPLRPWFRLISRSRVGYLGVGGQVYLPWPLQALPGESGGARGGTGLPTAPFWPFCCPCSTGS